MKLLIVLLFCFGTAGYASTLNHHNDKQPIVPIIEVEQEEEEDTTPTYTYTPPVVHSGITEPDGGTVWTHNRSGTLVEWSGLEGQYIKVELYKGNQIVEELSGWLEGVDAFIIPGLVKSEWGSGSDFRIRVYDNLENEFWSDEFQILSTVQVTDPGQYVSWSTGMTGASVRWSGCQGNQVKCEVYQNGSYIDDFSGFVDNTGEFVRILPIPATWGTGSGFTVRVTDTNGNIGTSAQFDICGIYVAPFQSDSLPDVIQWTGGNVVARIELFSGDEVIADLSGPIDNEGFFNLGESLERHMGNYSEPCRLKVTGDLGEFGWSDVLDLSYQISVSTGPIGGMEFAAIPSGGFQMGSPSSESGRDSDEERHSVYVSSFELMTTEVTQGMWEEVMGDNPSYDYGVGDNYPVYYVSWNECQDFIDELNEMDPNHTYRLPSESEWEYACRAGTTARFYWGDSDSESTVSRYCWYTENSNTSTHPVGTKQPSAWGLYDMSGNVWEWCQDVFTSDYDDCPTDGSAHRGSGADRVLRGGGWRNDARNCRSANRYSRSPGNSLNNLGFRLARS